MKQSTTPKCPECKRTLVNRLVDYCLYCGEALPGDLQLTDQEKEVLKRQQLDQIEEDRRLRVEKETEEREQAIQRKARGDDGSVGITFPSFF